MNAFALKDMSAKIVKVSVQLLGKYRFRFGPVLPDLSNKLVCPVCTKHSNVLYGHALHFYIHCAAYGTQSLFGLVTEFTYWVDRQ